MIITAVVVEMPVTRHPPHRNPACSFSAPGSSMILASVLGYWNIPLSSFAISRSKVCVLFLQSNSPDNVSFASFVSLLTPSPCERLSRSLSTMS